MSCKWYFGKKFIGNDENLNKVNEEDCLNYRS